MVVVIVQSLSYVQLFATPWTVACQAPLSPTVFQSLLKFMTIESVMLFNHPILCRPPLLMSSVFPSIRAFSNESALLIRWPKYWSFSSSISPSNEYSELISFSTDWLEIWLNCLWRMVAAIWFVLSLFLPICDLKSVKKRTSFLRARLVRLCVSVLSLTCETWD